MRPPSYFSNERQHSPIHFWGLPSCFILSASHCISYIHSFTPSSLPPKKKYFDLSSFPMKCSFFSPNPLLGRNKNILIRFDRCLPSIFESNQTRRTVQTCKEEKKRQKKLFHCSISLLCYSKLRTCLRTKKTNKRKKYCCNISKQLFMPIRLHPYEVECPELNLIDQV